MMTAQQGPGKPFDLHGCEGLGSRLMLEEEEGEEEEMGGTAGRRRVEMAAFARAWRGRRRRRRWRHGHCMYAAVLIQI